MALQLIPGTEQVFIAGDKTGVLLLHEFGFTPGQMSLLVNEFRQKGLSVCAPLLKGHGTKPQDLKRISWYDWFEDVKKALIRLRQACEKIFIIGFKKSNLLGLHLAAHYQVEGVIALAPEFVNDRGFLKYLPQMNPFVRYIKLNSIESAESMIGSGDSEGYEKIPKKAFRELRQMYSHVKVDLHDVYAPLLVVYSKKDGPAAGGAAEFIYQRVSSDNRRILAVDDGLTEDSWQNCRDILLRETENFLQTIQ